MTVYGDAPGRIAEQAEDQEAGMGGYGVDAQVLRLMNLSSRGCFAATLFRSPGGNCIGRVGHAERGVGVVGKAGVRQAGGNLPVVGVRRLVLVGAFQTSAAAILIEQVGNCVSFLANA